MLINIQVRVYLLAKDTGPRRYKRAEDLPASIVRQASAGYNMEQAIRKVIGSPCIITESDMNLEQNTLDFEMEIPDADGDPYLESITLSIHGSNAEMTAVRAFSVRYPSDMDRIIRLGSETPLDMLDGCRPKLEINICEDTLIITLGVTCRISDIPEIHRVEEAIRAVEFAMLKS